MPDKENTPKTGTPIASPISVTGYSEIKKLANNVLYLDDSSDFSATLWEILEIVEPDLYKDSAFPKLEYIEEL